jgi:hypothetical protein
LQSGIRRNECKRRASLRVGLVGMNYFNAKMQRRKEGSAGVPPAASPILPDAKNFKSGLEKIICFCWNRDCSEKIM